MKAKVTKVFPGLIGGKVRDIAIGEMIEGELAEVAVREKWADEVKEGEPAGKSLEDMTVAELKAHAEANGINLGDATKKADIVKAIAKAGR